MNNAHGLDADYFIRLCAREFSPEVIRNQNPEELARAFARAARTACAEVLQEREFQTGAAAHDVLAERRRQITAEGWTPAHDDLYVAAELPRAAAAYILNGANDDAPCIWPFTSKWWKPKDARTNYVRAGAMILAEIDRLDRAEQAKQQEQQP